MFRTAPEIIAETVEPSPELVEEMAMLHWMTDRWLVVYGENVALSGIEITENEGYAWIAENTGFNVMAFPVPDIV